MRAKQDSLVASERGIDHFALKIRFTLSLAMTPCQFSQHVETDVVPRARVLAAWVPQPDNEFHTPLDSATKPAGPA
jgi:hypothetical protein